MSAPFVVPALDLGPYVGDGTPAERAACARALDDACRRTGFMQVHGHGVPDAVVAGLGAAMDDLFALPEDVKRRWIRPPEENRGYTPPRTERLGLSLGLEGVRMNDLFEAFNVGVGLADLPDPAAVPAELAAHYAPSTWPDVPGFESRVRAWFAEAARVARTLGTVMADALGLPSTAFDDLAGHGIQVLRLNHYALPPGTPVPPGSDLTGMGEHTDFGLVTVLWADDEPGLQVLDADGVWHDVSPEPGALLVNLGDLTARLTNERWLSTLHRVRPPILDGTVRRRRSAAFFHDGDADALIAPWAALLAPGEEPRYDPVTVDAHVRAKLAGSRAGVRNGAAERELARVRAAAAR